MIFRHHLSTSSGERFKRAGLDVFMDRGLMPVLGRKKGESHHRIDRLDHH